MTTLKCLMSLLGYLPIFTKILKSYSIKSADTSFKCLIWVIRLYDAISQLKGIFDLIIKWDEVSQEALSTIWS